MAPAVAVYWASTMHGPILQHCTISFCNKISTARSASLRPLSGLHASLSVPVVTWAATYLESDMRRPASDGKDPIFAMLILLHEQIKQCNKHNVGCCLFDTHLLRIHHMETNHIALVIAYCVYITVQLRVTE